ncbi:hypothetical protein XENOCAPTIV_010023 [Xenoophorus captivus]|uniref:Uncharacterized protein n=1 Tax=Xenoophorus captivus TaxID=1517983 RepID=A0ABV0R0W7_9TELE
MWDMWLLCGDDGDCLHGAAAAPGSRCYLPLAAVGLKVLQGYYSSNHCNIFAIPDEKLAHTYTTHLLYTHVHTHAQTQIIQKIEGHTNTGSYFIHRFKCNPDLIKSINEVDYHV